MELIKQVNANELGSATDKKRYNAVLREMKEEFVLIVKSINKAPML